MTGNSQSYLEGRVEIRLKGGNDSDWGTICDDHFDIRDAKVACRMLGHDGAKSVVWAYDSYGSGPEDNPIWLDNLKCRGDENSLMECKHRGWGINNCVYWEAVGVVCKNESIPTVAPNGRLSKPCSSTFVSTLTYLILLTWLKAGKRNREAFSQHSHRHYILVSQLRNV